MAIVFCNGSSPNAQAWLDRNSPTIQFILAIVAVRFRMGDLMSAIALDADPARMVYGFDPSPSAAARGACPSDVEGLSLRSDDG